MSFQAIVSCHVVCIVCHAIRSMSLIFGRIYLYACRLHGILTIEDLGFACLWAAACFLLSPGDSWRTCFRPWLLSSSLVVDWLLSSLIFDISPGQALSNPFVLLMIELFDLSLTDASWWLSTNWRTASRVPCRRWHDVNASDKGRGSRRRATALVGRRLKAGQLERVRRRWGGAALPGGAGGGIYRTRPWGCDVSEVEYEYHHHDAEEDRGDPSDNEVDIPFGRALLHHVYPMKCNLVNWSWMSFLIWKIRFMPTLPFHTFSLRLLTTRLILPNIALFCIGRFCIFPSFMVR